MWATHGAGDTKTAMQGPKAGSLSGGRVWHFSAIVVAQGKVLHCGTTTMWYRGGEA